MASGRWMEIVDSLPIELSVEEVKDRLRTLHENVVQRLLNVAKPLISPKATYRVCYIEEKYEDAIVISRTRLTSRVLRKNLDEVGRVFPYIVTIGKGLEEKADHCTDLLEKYYLDTIGNIALMKARKQLENHLCSKFAVSSLSSMGPGSLQDWPIDEQRPLFSILQGAKEAIGLTLTESLLMIPRKSVSGIYFPTDVTFYSCQLCSRERCEGRKAAYDETLARDYGILE
jgi:hypothetical protein